MEENKVIREVKIESRYYEDDDGAEEYIYITAYAEGEVVWEGIEGDSLYDHNITSTWLPSPHKKAHAPIALLIDNGVPIFEVKKITQQRDAVKIDGCFMPGQMRTVIDVEVRNTPNHCDMAIFTPNSIDEFYSDVEGTTAWVGIDCVLVSCITGQVATFNVSRLSA